MDRWTLGFYNIEQVNSGYITLSSLKFLKLINETNGIYKRNCSFRKNIVEKVFQIISCIEIFENEIKIYTNVH